MSGSPCVMMLHDSEPPPYLEVFALNRTEYGWLQPLGILQMRDPYVGTATPGQGPAFMNQVW